MNYNLKPAKIEHPGEAEYYANTHNGYELFEDEKCFYSAWVENGKPDPTTWAIVDQYGENVSPIYTREYCEYQGIDRKEFDTVKIIE